MIKCAVCRFFVQHGPTGGHVATTGNCTVSFPPWFREKVLDGESHAVYETDGCDLGKHKLEGPLVLTQQ